MNGDDERDYAEEAANQRLMEEERHCPYPTHESGYHGWHDRTESGCEPYWQYCLDGYDITSEPWCDMDADEKRLWEGPDEPSEVWTRVHPEGQGSYSWGPWERVDGYENQD